MTDTEVKRAPALRISNIVRGRTNDQVDGTGRVRYLVDPHGNGEERAIPEDIVLKRWRRRVMSGHTFHGCRLGPNTWRAVARAFGSDAVKICKLDVEAISEGRAKLHGDRQVHHLWLPDVSTCAMLFSALGPKRLQAILDRHLSPERENNYGTPDLFLYACRTPDRQLSFYRLVEVKRPRERVSQDQEDEIAFLRSIGVPARVLRLCER